MPRPTELEYLQAIQDALGYLTLSDVKYVVSTKLGDQAGLAAVTNRLNRLRVAGTYGPPARNTDLVQVCTEAAAKMRAEFLVDRIEGLLAPYLPEKKLF